MEPTIHEKPSKNSALTPWLSTAQEYCRPRPREGELADSWIKRASAHYRDDLEALFDNFTNQRSMLGKYLNDPKRAAAAYLLRFHLPNQSRCRALLERVDQRHPWKQLPEKLTNDLQLVDIGCGTGSLAEATLDYLPFELGSIRLVDKQGAFLDTARSLLGRKSPKKTRILKIRHDWLRGVFDLRLEPSQPRLIGLSYIWNELENQKFAKVNLGKWLKRQIESPTLLLLVDSAQQNASRSLILLRDELVEAGYQPIYPCPSTAVAACPMLGRGRDWCFSELKGMDLPREQHLVEAAAGMTKMGRLDFASTMFAMVSPAWQQASGFDKRHDSGVVVGLPVHGGKAVDPGKARRSLLICEGTNIRRTQAADFKNLPLRGTQWTSKLPYAEDK